MTDKQVFEDPLVMMTMAVYHTLDDAMPIGRRLETALDIARRALPEAASAPAPARQEQMSLPVEPPRSKRRPHRRRPSLSTVQHWERMRSVLEPLQNLNSRDAADELNRRGVTTVRGGKWHCSTVWKLRERLGMNEEMGLQK